MSDLQEYLKFIKITYRLLEGKEMNDDKIMAPLHSLLAEQEKTMTKLGVGKWQHTMLEKNIFALKLPLTLMTNEESHVNPIALLEPLAAIEDMLLRTKKAQDTKTVGSAQSSLLSNRYKALLAAKKCLLEKS